MSEYNRTTRECTVSQLHPAVLQAFRTYFQEPDRGDLESEALLCCETISRKKDSDRLISWLSATVDTTIHIGMLLTAEQLIWARSGDVSGTLLSSAHLANISVRVYSPLFSKDIGLEVSGYMDGTKGAMRGYIAMGPEPITQKFCDEVQQAIAKVNPPNQRKWPKWMGG